MKITKILLILLSIHFLYNCLENVDYFNKNQLRYQGHVYERSGDAKESRCRPNQDALQCYNYRLNTYIEIVGNGYFAGTGRRGQNMVDGWRIELHDGYDHLSEEIKEKTRIPPRFKISDDGTGGIATGVGMMGYNY